MDELDEWYQCVESIEMSKMGWQDYVLNAAYLNWIIEMQEFQWISTFLTVLRMKMTSYSLKEGILCQLITILVNDTGFNQNLSSLFIEPLCFISIDKAVNGESNRDKISKGDSSIS